MKDGRGSTIGMGESAPFSSAFLSFRIHANPQVSLWSCGTGLLCTRQFSFGNYLSHYDIVGSGASRLKVLYP